jgi:enoyl-CoA hydratase/carnithine racemase
MAIVEWKKEGTVALLTMNNGENRHNPDFAKSMLNAFDEIEKEESIFSVVITSSDKKNWSLGIDLEWAIKAMEPGQTRRMKAFMYQLNELSKRILLFPMPVIAAINGHVFGDGAVLACACDFRYMKADRGFFCFPEIDIDIPHMPSMLAIVKKAMPYYEVEELIFSGKHASAKELELSHAIRRACENEDALLKEVMEFAGSFTKKRPIFRETKKRLYRYIIGIMETQDPEFIETLQVSV